MNIRTTDNNCGVPFSGTSKKSLHGTKFDYQNLAKIANTPLSELVKSNPSLLVFPKVLGYHKDGIEDEEIFNLHGNPEKLEDVTLKTGNLMGFVGIGDTQLKISSRFAKDDEQDFFLHYMLEKVFSINLFDFEQQISKDGALDLLMFSFPLLLKKALAQGIFRQYQTFNRNDANVKGVIDVSRHIRQNIPFAGKVAYNSRERTFDNAVTQLIRHTIEYIQTKPLGKELLTKNYEIKKCVQEILEATQSYNLQNREKVIAQNLKPISHPYYTAYKPLQKLCLAILYHRKIGYGNTKNKAYGILFDGAWLWEEYLATVLVPAGFKHPRNKSETGAISAYKGNPRYPDFYKGEQIKNFQYGESIPEENDILDAKYKRLENSSIDRDDLHQLVTYMHILPAKSSGLVYPLENGSIVRKNGPWKILGLGGTITTYGLPIPQKNVYKEFIESMRLYEEKLLESVDYNFYGWQTADCKPADSAYEKIENPRHLYDILSQIWCADTCAPRMRAKWSRKNQTLGQCSITAFLAQDIFGGKVYGILREGGNYHCYNVVGDCVFDLTSEQFGDEKLCYENNPEQFREVHWQKEEKHQRYNYLKAELLKKLEEL